MFLLPYLTAHRAKEIQFRFLASQAVTAQHQGPPYNAPTLKVGSALVE